MKSNIEINERSVIKEVIKEGPKFVKVIPIGLTIRIIKQFAYN